MRAQKEQIVRTAKVIEDGCEEWKRSFKCSAITDVLSNREKGEEWKERERKNVPICAISSAWEKDLAEWEIPFCVLAFIMFFFFHYSLSLKSLRREGSYVPWTVIILVCYPCWVAWSRGDWKQGHRGDRGVILWELTQQEPWLRSFRSDGCWQSPRMKLGCSQTR